MEHNRSTEGPGASAERVLTLAGRLGLVRPRDLEAAGIPRVYLTRLVRRGRNSPGRSGWLCSQT
ncbi:MAG TPA: type IV toxin-antitoxin system AbiEi family antitoxin domain-containing protein [Armatimonadota bacterium]